MSVRHHPKAAAPVLGGGGAKCTRLAINGPQSVHAQILSAHSLHVRAASAIPATQQKGHTKKVTATWRGGDLSAGDNTCPTKAATMRAGQPMITTAIYEHRIKTRAVHHASARVPRGSLAASVGRCQGIQMHGRAHLSHSCNANPSIGADGSGARGAEGSTRGGGEQHADAKHSPGQYRQASQ